MASRRSRLPHRTTPTTRSRAFLDRGIDVICDKPLATGLPDALDLVERGGAASGLVFAVTYAFAAHAMVRQAREMVRNGALGAVRHVHVEYFQEWALKRLPGAPEQREWRLDAGRIGAGFTTGNIGTHAYHLACFVTGLKAEALRAELHVLDYDKPVEDTAFVHLRFESGVSGTLMVSQAAAGAQRGLRLRVFGTEASLEWDQENSEFLHYRQFDAPAPAISRGFGGGEGPAAARFVRMPRGHPEGLTDARANLYTEVAVAVEERRNGEHLADGLLEYPTVDEGHGVSALSRRRRRTAPAVPGSIAECSDRPMPSRSRRPLPKPVLQL
jgi:predicted dehydrogenase